MIAEPQIKMMPIRAALKSQIKGKPPPASYITPLYAEPIKSKGITSPISRNQSGAAATGAIEPPRTDW